jgi:hypothetical protein
VQEQKREIAKQRRVLEDVASWKKEEEKDAEMTRNKETLKSAASKRPKKKTDGVEVDDTEQTDEVEVDETEQADEVEVDDTEQADEVEDLETCEIKRHKIDK